MNKLFKIASLLISLYAIVISAIHFSEKETQAFDIEMFKRQYELQLQQKSDSLKLAEVTIARSKQITDSLADRYIASHPIKDIEVMSAPALNERIEVTRKELMIYQNALLRVELNDKMIEEIPEIVKRESEKAYKDGMKKGLLYGGVIGFVFGLITMVGVSGL